MRWAFLPLIKVANFCWLLYVPVSATILKIMYSAGKGHFKQLNTGHQSILLILVASQKWWPLQRVCFKRWGQQFWEGNYLKIHSLLEIRNTVNQCISTFLKAKRSLQMVMKYFHMWSYFHNNGDYQTLYCTLTFIVE